MMLQHIRKTRNSFGFTTTSSHGRGFTLVELLVVIAIVAILAVVVLVAINPLETLRKSRNTRRLTEINQVKDAINLAISAGGGSVAPFAASAALSSCPTATPPVWVVFADPAIVLTRYMQVLPNDPVNVATGLNYCYIFKTNTAGDAFELTTRLEATSDSCATMNNDGGNETDPAVGCPGVAARYEAGTDLTL